MDKGPRILIVEDEPVIAMDIEAELEMRGWRVVGPAGTVSRALDLLNAEEVDGAVLDINLQGTDSFEIADVLKRRNIPFIFLSGDDGLSRPDELQETPLLSKPINYAQLHEALKRETDQPVLVAPPRPEC